VHDFIDKDLGKAIPYGVYDIAANCGWVSVGTDAGTAQFAVNTLRTWWKKTGRPAYPHASLFSFISKNWRGRPLTSHEVIISTIAATTTKTGLTIQAELDTSSYPTGIKITDRQMRAFEKTRLHRHGFHGDWNYTIGPSTTSGSHPSQDQHLDSR